MSFYRSILAAVAAVVITSPVFAADDAAANAQGATDESTPAIAQQLADNTGTGSTATTGTTDEQTTATTTTKVNLNTATAKQLAQVKGITTAKAKAIVSFRKKHGEFKTTEDLKKVKGFTKMKAEALKEIEDQLDI